jgi:hypothetical protein
LLRRVALVRTDVSEESGASFIKVTNIGELETTQAATSNRRTLRRNTKPHLVFLRSVRRLLVAACIVSNSPILVTLMKEAPDSSETSVLTRATRRNNPEDTILASRMYVSCCTWSLLLSVELISGPCNYQIKRCVIKMYG